MKIFEHFGKIMVVIAALAWFCVWPVSSSTLSFTYDPAGRLVSAVYGTNRSTSYAYDNAGNLLQSAAPSPAIIIGPIMGGQLTLSWPASPGGFTLQSATTISPGANWADTGLTPTQAGDLLVVIVPLGPGTTFYRLRK